MILMQRTSESLIIEEFRGSTGGVAISIQRTSESLIMNNLMAPLSQCKKAYASAYACVDSNVYLICFHGGLYYIDGMTSDKYKQYSTYSSLNSFTMILHDSVWERGGDVLCCRLVCPCDIWLAAVLEFCPAFKVEREITA